jgi:hypothetical protein
MLMLLFSTLFYPAIADAAGWAQADMIAKGIDPADYWGLSNVFGAVRIILFTTGIMMSFIGVAVWWLKRK